MSWGKAMWRELSAPSLAPSRGTRERTRKPPLPPTHLHRELPLHGRRVAASQLAIDETLWINMLNPFDAALLHCTDEA